MTYIVKIIHTSTGEVVRSSKELSERQALKMWDAYEINLNFSEYHIEMEML